MNKSALHCGGGPAAACSAVVLLGGAVYVNALHNPFIYDDYHTVVANASIVHIADVRAVVMGAVTRPIVNVSYAIDYALWGAKPFGFHVTNVVLHMLNVALLFQLARRFEDDERTDSSSTAGASALVPFVAAALLAVHPMMTEAVGYISGRSEVLCATFFLLAMWCGRRWIHENLKAPDYIRGGISQRLSHAWAALTVSLWIAALATKESAAMFPFVLLAYDCLALRPDADGRRRRLRTMHLPLIGTGILAGILRLMIFFRLEYPAAHIHWAYALVDLDVIRRYFWLIIRPAGQTIFHEVPAVQLFDLRTPAALAVLALLLGVVWRLRRAEWTASLGILWFLLVLLPSSTLTLLDQGEPMAEHRVYLASYGLFLASGAAVGRLASRLVRSRLPARLMATAALVLVLLSFSLETILRNTVWHDPVALWQESVDLAPTHFRPRLLLGEVLQNAGRRDDAMEQYNRAIRLRPTDPEGYVKVGQMLAEVGRWSAARDQFNKALEIDPGDAAAHHSLVTLDAVESRFEPLVVDR